jgi:protein TonB
VKRPIQSHIAMSRAAAPDTIIDASAAPRIRSPSAPNARRLAIAALALGLAGCDLLKPATKSDDASARSSSGATANAGSSEAVAPVRLITAQTPAIRAYRKIGATHIYKTYPKRIYKGKIPPLVYAVVVTETDIDANGQVTGVYFSRTPSHAPEVSGKIAQLIKDASPLPSPGKIGGHTYVETWLWDKSGQFQLDSLTLGQRSR